VYCTLGLERCSMDKKPVSLEPELVAQFDAIERPFDPAEPSGEYTLDLANKAMRNMAQGLLQLVQARPREIALADDEVSIDGNAKKITLVEFEIEVRKPKPASPVGGKRFSPVPSGKVAWHSDAARRQHTVDGHTHTMIVKANQWREGLPGAHSDEEWLMPRRGQFAVRIRYERRTPSLVDCLTHEAFKTLNDCLSAICTEHRMTLIHAMVDDVWLSREQMEAIVRLFPSKGRPKMMSVLLRRTVLGEGYKNSLKHDLFDFGLTTGEAVILGKFLGPYFTFEPSMPTARYVLDLSSTMERALVVKLLQLNNDMKAKGKESGCSDTSQTGSWDNFRNVTLNGEPFALRGKMGT